jgi:metal-responsive CopG/Arc/MetJ family transcriptional regulator
MVALWMPRPLDIAIDKAVVIEDTDRSKFIRRAVREKLQRMRIKVPEEIVEEAR